jgi:hypothetical protein
MNPEAWGTWALAFITLFGAILLVVQLRTSTRQRRDDSTAQRRQRTYETCVGVLDAASRDRRLPNDRDNASIHRATVLARYLPAYERSIQRYLNQWEAVAVGLKMGVLDREVFDSLESGRVVEMWRNYFPYISLRRERVHAPNAWVELESLVHSLGLRS